MSLNTNHVPPLWEPPGVPPAGVLPADPEGEQLIIEEGGFIKWVDGEKVLLHQIYVQKEFRHKGVGRKLMQRFKEAAKGKPMYLHTTADKNNPFYHFLVSEGWKEEGYDLWVCTK